MKITSVLRSILKNRTQNLSFRIPIHAADIHNYLNRPKSKQNKYFYFLPLMLTKLPTTVQQALHTILASCSLPTTVVSYINKQGGTHSPNLCIEVSEILHWCLEHDVVIRIRHIPGKFNILTDRRSRLDRPIDTEWALDQLIANSIFQMLSYLNVDLFAM